MRDISEFMNKWQGRKVSDSQRLAIKEWERMSSDLENMREQKQILLRCNLDREAKALQLKINALEHERQDFEDRLNEERKEMAKAILGCLVGCDFVTLSADRFADTTHRLSRGLYGADNKFSQDIRKQADEFNKIVQLIDQGGNDVAAMYYSDMAEDINKEMFALVDRKIKEWMEKGKGKMYF